MEKVETILGTGAGWSRRLTAFAIGSLVICVALAISAAGAEASKAVPGKASFDLPSFYESLNGKEVWSLSGKLRSKNEACSQRGRRAKVFFADGRGLVGKGRSRYGTWWANRVKPLRKGDRIYVRIPFRKFKVKGERVTCAAVKSKVYRVRKVRQLVES